VLALPRIGLTVLVCTRALHGHLPLDPLIWPSGRSSSCKLLTAMPVQTENIGMGDAQAFPLVASAGLFSLFLVFTFFKEYVTVILTIYACGLGVFSTASMIGPMVESVLPGWFSTAKVSFFVPTIPHNAVTGALGLAEPPTGEPGELCKELCSLS
jgi:hypothetical protein